MSIKPKTNSKFILLVGEEVLDEEVAGEGLLLVELVELLDGVGKAGVDLLGKVRLAGRVECLAHAVDGHLVDVERRLETVVVFLALEHRNEFGVLEAIQHLGGEFGWHIIEPCEHVGAAWLLLILESVDNDGQGDEGHIVEVVARNVLDVVVVAVVHIVLHRVGESHANHGNHP